MASYMILIIAAVVLVLVLVGINYLMVSRLYSDKQNAPGASAPDLTEPEQGTETAEQNTEVVKSGEVKEEIKPPQAAGQYEKRRLMLKDDHYRHTLKTFRESHHTGNEKKENGTVSADHEYRQAMRSMGHKKS